MASAVLVGEKTNKPENRAFVNPMARRFLKAFAGTLWLDPVKAAQEAGYSRPDEDGPRLMEKFSKIIERDKMRLFRLQQMSPLECQALLSGIGRGQLAATPQQVKSLELVARIHGMLSDKVDVTIEQPSIEAAVARLVSHTPRETRALPPGSGEQSHTE